MSRIRYNFKMLASGFPAQHQEAVARMGAGTRRFLLRTVNVNWNDDGWNANANALDAFRWNDDNQVFSRNYWGSLPTLRRGSLSSNPFFQP